MGYNSLFSPPLLRPSKFIIAAIESETLTFSLKNQKESAQHTCAVHVCKHAMYVAGRIRRYRVRKQAACLLSRSQLQLSEIVPSDTLRVFL